MLKLPGLIAIWLQRVLGGLDLVKVVLVELTDKAGKVVVLEMLWEDDLCKLVGLLDDECVASLAPGDYEVVFFLFEHPVQLLDKVGDTCA